MKRTTEVIIIILITFGLIFCVVTLALTLPGCAKSNNLIIQYCNEEQTEDAIRFYEHCLGNWGKLSEYGCQVRSVENYCNARPKIKRNL